MKVLILNPPRYGNASVTREGRCEIIIPNRVDTPSSLLIMASILRQLNNKVEFLDCNGLDLNYKAISRKIKNIEYDCVVFTFNSEIIDYELKICELVKQKNPSCITIGYSWYARNHGKEIINEFKNLDILMINDPFTVIENIVNTLNHKNNLSNVEGIVYRNNGNVNVNPPIKSRKKLNDLPLPAYDLVSSFKPYHLFSPLLRPYALVYAGKGCPYQCKFCLQANSNYDSKSAENILKDLKLLKKVGKIKYVWFFDETFTVNRKKVIEICQGIIRERIKIKWLCDSRVELVDLPLLVLMKKAGCIGISYGVESGSQKILDAMNKGNTVEQALKALKMTRKARIPIQLNLVLGYIGETVETLKETELFVKKTLPEILQVTRIYPLYGSEFSKIAEKEGWLEKGSGWKADLDNHSIVLTENYAPSRLDLSREIRRFKKMIARNPKWMAISAITMLRNLVLIKPVFGLFVSRMQRRITRFLNKH